jgi:hypothetical protein
MPLRKFTVITLRDDTGEVMSCVQRAHDPHEAMAQVATAIHKSMTYSSDTQVICAIPGDHDIMQPCEDSSKAAYVADLIEEEEEVVMCPDGAEISRADFNAGAH